MISELKTQLSLRAAARNGIILLLIFCAADIFSTARFVQAVEPFPKPVGAVNDYAKVIAPAARSGMEKLAREVLEKTGTSIVVATVETIGENDADQYANELYAAWGIGKKGEDKGVLIFVAARERKIRIETGYGVESILPDGLVGEILDRDVVPYLRTGNYSQGLQNAMISVSQVIARDAGVTLTGAPSQGAPQVRTRGKSGGVLPTIFIVLAVFFLLGTRTGRAMLPYILLMLMSGGDRRGRGGFDGFGGGFGGFGGGMSGGGGASRGF